MTQNELNQAILNRAQRDALQNQVDRIQNLPDPFTQADVTALTTEEKNALKEILFLLGDSRIVQAVNAIRPWASRQLSALDSQFSNL